MKPSAEGIVLSLYPPSIGSSPTGKPLPPLPESEGKLLLGTIQRGEKSGLLHVSVMPPKDGPKRPCVVVCLIDVSGSMAGAATDANTGETDGFSILDLVKHSVETIITTLEPDDSLSLIAFESSTRILLKPTRMDEAGKKTAMEQAKSLKDLGGTNLWEGLKVSIDMIKEDPVCQGANTSLWLFTDGVPDSYPGGIAPALTKYLKGASPPCVINTFGFGYSLDSELLYQIAELGNGIFCYIPDCNLVGTTFVNCLCNTMSTAMFKARLRVKATGVKNLKCIGYEVREGKVELGTVLYGQSRDIVFSFDMKSPTASISFSAQYKCNAGMAEQTISGFAVADPIALHRNYCRSEYDEIIRSGLVACVGGSKDTAFLKRLEDIIACSPSKDDPAMKALMIDLVSANEMEGRVGKAFSTEERIKRWGAHYVRSMIRAHKLQMCHNFKDPGVQVYGGDLFKKLQLKADKVFCSLPAPVPSLQRVKKAVGQADAPASAPVDMQTYMSCGGGCFGGLGLVSMADGTKKRVIDLVRGDTVLSNGVGAKVLCLVVFPIHGKTQMATVSGMKITPKHPILSEGVWKYPRETGKVEEEYCDFIYNVVLDQGHTVTINGVEAVTLGHGKHDNITVRHAYYGSQRVVEDIKRFSGWTEGKVLMAGCKKYRDPFSGAVMCIAN